MASSLFQDEPSANKRRPSRVSSIQNAALPTITEFTEALLPEPDWYSLGIFLGASTAELDTIGINYRGVSTMRCYIELYSCLKSRDIIPSWEFIIDCLQRMNKDALAKRITSKFIKSLSSSDSLKNKEIEVKGNL